MPENNWNTTTIRNTANAAANAGISSALTYTANPSSSVGRGSSIWFGLRRETSFAAPQFGVIHEDCPATPPVRVAY
jgi:hypothetical protein